MRTRVLVALLGGAAVGITGWALAIVADDLGAQWWTGITAEGVALGVMVAALVVERVDARRRSRS